MDSVLKIRDKKTGKWISIDAVRGDPGKSAYEQAVEGGFTGTEEEFIGILNATVSLVNGTHTTDKNNPHETTAGQVGALPITGGTATGNIGVYKETTPVFECVTKNGMSQLFKNASNTTDGGLLLTDYADKNNKTEKISLRLCHRMAKESPKEALVVTLSNANGNTAYKIYGEHNKPNASDVGALSETIHIDGKDVLSIEDEGYYYSGNSKNVPEGTNAGYVRVVVGGTGYRVVYWRPHNSDKEYVNVLTGGTWLGWKEIFTSAGGTLTGSLGVSAGYGRFAADANCASVNAYSDAQSLSNRRSIYILNSKYTESLVGALVLRNTVNDSMKDYKIFGEHNKPTGTYEGSGQTTTKTVSVGGMSNMLLITSSNGMALVTSKGAWWKPTNNTNINGVIANECNYTNGVLTLNTTAVGLNGTNVTYTFQVL